MPTPLPLLSLVALLCGALALSSGIAAVPAAQAPRTLILAGRADAFRAYCTSGEGAKAFGKIRDDFDRDFAHFVVPPEPLTYGDPSPS